MLGSSIVMKKKLILTSNSRVSISVHLPEEKANSITLLIGQTQNDLYNMIYKIKINFAQISINVKLNCPKKKKTPLLD